MSDKRRDRSDAFALEANMLQRFGPEDMPALLEKAAAKRQELERQALAPAPARARPETKTAQFRPSKKTATATPKMLGAPPASKAAKSTASSALTEAHERKPTTKKKS